MMISNAALTILISNFLALPAIAAGIDCTKAASTSDHLICADQSLRARDSILGDLYAAAIKGDDAGKIKQQQQRWVKSLQSCADAACIRTTYDDRICNLLASKGGQSVSTNFSAENANGNEGNLSIFGPVDGLAAVFVTSTFVGPGGADAGDVNADNVSGVIPLKDGHGKLSSDNCSIGLDRLNARTWHVSQSGACQFANGVAMQGTYRRQ